MKGDYFYIMLAVALQRAGVALEGAMFLRQERLGPFAHQRVSLMYAANFPG